MAAPSASGSTAPGSGSDSPVRTLRSNASAVGPNEPQVGRHHVAGTEQDDVAWDQLAREDIVDLAVPPDAGGGCRGFAQRLERLLAAVLGDDAGPDDRGEDHQDEQAVPDFVERDRQAAGDEQHDDERLARAVPEQPQQRDVADFFELIRTELREPRGGLFICEAGGGIGPESLENGDRWKVRSEARKVAGRIGGARALALAGGQVHGNPPNRAGSAARSSRYRAPAPTPPLE